MGGMGWRSRRQTFKCSGDPHGVPALWPGSPSSALWEPEESRSPNAPQGPVLGATRPPRKTLSRAQVEA